MGCSMALRADKKLNVWGTPYTYNPTLTNVPSGLSNVVAMAGGWFHCLAVKSDGSVVAWGNYWNGGLAVVPANLSNVVAVAGGDSHSLALKADGTVAAWGVANTNVPGNLSARAKTNSDFRLGRWCSSRQVERHVDRVEWS